MPRISSKGEKEENEIYKNSEIETDEPISEIYEQEDAHSRIRSNLHNAVQRWKEEKDILKEERQPGAMTKIFKKFFKKDKKDNADYDEVKKFLSKISLYNPEETEDINLDKIKQQIKEEPARKHEKSIIGEKLEIEQKEVRDIEKEKQKIEQVKEKKEKYMQEIEKRKQKHKEEIEEAIKKHNVLHKETEEPKGIFHKRRHLDIIEEEIKEEDLVETEQEMPEKEVKKTGIKFDKIRQNVTDKMGLMHAKLKESIHKIKGKIQKPIELNEYPEKYLKEKDDYKERQRYFLKKQKVVTTQKLPRPKHEIDADIEKIYKEIEQLK